MIPLKDNIPTDRLPWVTIGLIAVNVIVYLLAASHGGSLISGPDPTELVRYGAIPYALSHPSVHCGVLSATQLACTPRPGVVDGLPTWETVVTSMFMHASILHLGGNMLFLWVFGNNVEDAMGPFKFIAFYVLGGIAALALQTVVDPNSVAPTVGASGAIAGVLGGYIVLYPRARVLTLIFLIIIFFLRLPAVVVLGFWFAEQAVFAAVGLTNPAGGGGGVAYFAHVGGFVFGLLTIRALARRRRTASPRGVAW